MCQACNPGTLAVMRALTPRLRVPADVGNGLRRHRRTPTGPHDHPPVADAVLTGGTVLTMRAAEPRAEAVAVRDGALVAVGTDEEIAALTGPGTERIDLDGRCVLPGLVDPHMHLGFTAFDDWLDLSPMATPTADLVLDRLRGAVAATPAGEWIRAKQLDPSITVGLAPPTRSELDALAPDHPVFLLEGNGHIAYVNGRAIALAGIDRDTPDPPTARFGHDATGELSGRLEETAAFAPFVLRMPLPSPEELVARGRRLLDHAASVGCTALHDCGIGMVAGPGDLTVLQQVMAGDPPVRYRGMLVSTAMDRWDELGLRPGDGDDRLRLTGVKAWSDGSNQAGTGYQREPYVGGDDRGSLNYSADELAAVVDRAHRAGWQVGVHANGDAAIDTTIDAYEQALRATPRTDHRHRIEHCSVLHPDQIRRMAELGLSPSFLIGHVRWWGRAFRDRLLGPDRARLYDPSATALAAGLRISLHSDWNVTPLEPLRYVEDAVTRVMSEGGEVLNADERIPVEAALRAVTADAAWQCGLDGIVGSLEPGKRADLTVLEDDPTAVEPRTIAGIAVSETWLDGTRRFHR